MKYLLIRISVFFEMNLLSSILVPFFLILALPNPLWGNESKEFDFFEKKIRPIFIRNCYECHSEESKKLKGSLLLDRRDGWMKGGDSGPVIFPGDPNNSILIKAIRYESSDLQMPPDRKLSKEEIADIEQWVTNGANDPREEKIGIVKKSRPFLTKGLVEGRKYWAFKVLKDHPLPGVGLKKWPVDPIDYFILEKLESQKLKPAVKADPNTLLRRIYFDLTGLPPSPDQINAFVLNRSPDAYSKLVDNLLGSKRFGERWGRHWLDVARYADTTGGGRNKPFPNASRYRDYVINSFNKDKPFDRFIIEQIAGDLIPSDSDSEYNENLTGTGFLALGPHNYELQDKELLRMEVVDEQLSAVGRAFMGITMGCARCHDHPFDPIPTKDYYSMAGIFRSTNSLVPGNVASFHERELRDQFNLQRKEHSKIMASFEKKLKEALSVLKSLGGEKVNSTRSQRSLDPLSLNGIVIDDSEAKLSGKWISSTHINGFVGKRYLHDENKDKGNKSITFSANIPHDGEYEVQVSYTCGPNRSKRTPVTVMHADGEQKIHIDQSKAPKILGIFESVGKFQFDKKKREVVQITTEGTTKVVIADAIRLVPVGKESIANLSQSNPDDSENKKRVKIQIKDAEKQVAELKKSIEEHKKRAPPEVQKVMSILEQKEVGDCHIHLRGGIRNLGPIVPRGFLVVATPQSMSPYPQIPKSSSGRLELALWLSSPQNPLTARVFVNRVWHHLFGRGIVATPDNFGEMGNRPTHPELLDYLAQYFIAKKWSTKALIRKIVLSSAYKMSSSTSKYILNEDPENQLFSRQNRRRLEAEAIRDSMLLASGQISYKDSKVNLNRSLFKKIDRNKVPEIFDIFDYPNPGLVSGNRNTSTVPTQALYMMNNDFVINHAELTAKNILSLKNLDDREKIKLAFLICLGREPHEGERKFVHRYLNQGITEKISLKAMEGLVHSLFACLDFRYLN